MKKIIFLCVLIYSVDAFACTTFLLNDKGHYYFGRNYDWVTGNGMVMTNGRNIRKYSIEAGTSLTWVSRFGSITFNQYGKEFPTGGMNEKGLVVELMWLDGTRFPAEDARPALDVLQWVQYQLDNCGSIEEVIATDKKLRIETDGTPLHYLVADSSGHAATIEFLQGKMVVHKEKDLKFPVLTNTPYSESLQKTNAIVSQGKNATIADNSLQRFATACSMVRDFSSSGKNALDYSFSILDKVSQGQFTKWSIVYDISLRKIYFITSENKSRRQLSFSGFTLDCATPSMAIDLNQQGAGAIEKNFRELGFEMNKKMVETSVKQSSSHVTIPESAVRKVTEFYDKTTCIKDVKHMVTD